MTTNIYRYLFLDKYHSIITNWCCKNSLVNILIWYFSSLSPIPFLFLFFLFFSLFLLFFFLHFLRRRRCMSTTIFVMLLLLSILLFFFILFLLLLLLLFLIFSSSYIFVTTLSIPLSMRHLHGCRHHILFLLFLHHIWQ